MAPRKRTASPRDRLLLVILGILLACFALEFTLRLALRHVPGAP